MKYCQNCKKATGNRGRTLSMLFWFLFFWPVWIVKLITQKRICVECGILKR